MTQENPTDSEALKSRLDISWKTLVRFDQYITLFNTKANIIIAFESLLISSFVIKAGEIYSGFGTHKFMAGLAGAAIFVVAFSGVCALWHALSVVKPNLTTSDKPSKIFFVDVAKSLGKESEFSADYKTISQESMLEDICRQLPSLAATASAKSASNDRSVGAMKVQTCALGVAMMIKALSVAWLVIPHLVDVDEKQDNKRSYF